MLHLKYQKQKLHMLSPLFILSFRWGSSIHIQIRLKIMKHILLMIVNFSFFPLSEFHGQQYLYWKVIKKYAAFYNICIYLKCCTLLVRSISRISNKWKCIINDWGLPCLLAKMSVWTTNPTRHALCFIFSLTVRIQISNVGWILIMHPFKNYFPFFQLLWH